MISIVMLDILVMESRRDLDKEYEVDRLGMEESGGRSDKHAS